MAGRARSTAVQANLGLYLDRPAAAVPPGGLSDGNNFRIYKQKLSNLNLGWSRFGAFQLDGPGLLVSSFVNRTGTQRLIFATKTDLYVYNEGPETVSYLTPRYETGTVSVTNGSAAVTGTGTAWLTGLKAGDKVAFGASGVVSQNPAGGWYTVQSVDGDTQLTLTAPFSGTTQSGIAYTGRKLFTGGDGDVWCADTFYNVSGTDYWYATNGKDKVVRWDGTGTQAAYSAVEVKARTLRAYRNVMLYGDVTDISTGNRFPSSIANSDAGNPETVAAGIGGQYQVHNGDDGILAIEPLADAVALYSRRHVVLAQFVDEPLVFLFRVAVSGTGPIAPRAVANFRSYHEFLGHDAGYAFDGAALTEKNSHVWREVLRTRDPGRDGISHAVFDDERGELVWAVPLTTDQAGAVAPRTAFVEHFLEGAGRRMPTPFSRRDFPFLATGAYFRFSSITWADLTTPWANVNFSWNDKFFFAAFPFVLAVDEAGKIYTLNTAQTADGTAMASFAVSGRMAFSDGRERALLSRVYPFATQFAGKRLDVYLHLADNAMGAADRVGPYTLDLGLPQSTYFVTPYRRARYGAVEYRTAADPWELAGWDFDLKRGGRR